MKSKTLSVPIRCGASKVYGFVSELENLAKWAPVRIRIAPKNEMGVLDHWVKPEGGPEIYVPMRVTANGEGSEVTFTLFQHPGMTDEQFAADARLVERDLASLKAVLEA